MEIGRSRQLSRELELRILVGAGHLLTNSEEVVSGTGTWLGSVISYINSFPVSLSKQTTRFFFFEK